VIAAEAAVRALKEEAQKDQLVWVWWQGVNAAAQDGYRQLMVLV
jgi:hypothetical protein